MIEHLDLQTVEIFLDTATYDEIERDVKVTTEAALGLVGGTIFTNIYTNMQIYTNKQIYKYKYVKVTTEAALGLVGGTMGLLTGFSILSGVEILYYLVRLFLSLRVNRS